METEEILKTERELLILKRLLHLYRKSPFVRNGDFCTRNRRTLLMEKVLT